MAEVKLVIVKSSGERVAYDRRKVVRRVQRALDSPKPLSVVAEGLAEELTRVVESVLPDGEISTRELDELVANEVYARTPMDPVLYDELAARLMVHKIQKEAAVSFSDCIQLNAPELLPEAVSWIQENSCELDAAIKPLRDFDFDAFGIAILSKGSHPYLMRGETPQYLFMREAIQVNWNESERLQRSLETYEMLSRHLYTHATPTIDCALKKAGQLASCFLMPNVTSDIKQQGDTLRDMFHIGVEGGGIGVPISGVPHTHRDSTGVVELLSIFNGFTRYVRQNGKRPSSVAAYVPSWHVDVIEILETKNPNRGSDNNTKKFLNLHLALWNPDLLWKRYVAKGRWSFFDPADLEVDLDSVYGEEFERLYEEYEKRGLAKKTMKAESFLKILGNYASEIAEPYMLNKDFANYYSNQKHIGVVRSSNLCAEIIEVTKKDETAVCNLASICLPAMVGCSRGSLEFDFDLLRDVVRHAIRRLDNVIDVNRYPTESTSNSNFKHRPVGLGIQGLHDMLIKMRLPYESDAARRLNARIAEVMYQEALRASADLAVERGAFETSADCPAVKDGLLHHDLVEKYGFGKAELQESPESWEETRSLVKTNGLRNSLLIALMPTVTSSKILGNSDCFELRTSNAFLNTTVRGEYWVFNKAMVRDLQAEGLWNAAVINKLREDQYSVQGIEGLSEKLKALYKTAYEVPCEVQMERHRDRSFFVDQSSSFSFFVPTLSYKRWIKLQLDARNYGLVTASYYIHKPPKSYAFHVKVQEELCPGGSCSA